MTISAKLTTQQNYLKRRFCLYSRQVYFAYIYKSFCYLSITLNMVHQQTLLIEVTSHIIKAHPREITLQDNLMKYIQ